ncbi:MAG: hypothetical protein ACD_20C00042G0015 [uncultured bacterium]|nr:MAG: hypothetical protein ACD_20C00042G0015 [uncultured bacterium]
MQIKNLSNNTLLSNRLDNVRFGQGQINILATSDNHGQINSLDKFYGSVISNLDKVFPKKEEKSTLNVGAIAGDWFINPKRKNLLTNPTKTVGDYQLDFLNKFTGFIRDQVPNFKMLYTPGNHCFDGGDKYLIDHLKKADLTTILTNANLDNSPVLNDLSPEERKKIKQYTVLEVPDDKDPNKVHKALILGVTMMGADFYTPGLVKGIDITDRIDQKDINIKEENLKQTYKTLNSLISEFKNENPQGAVMILSHTGNKISEMIAKNVPNINIMLNGHDHVDQENVIKHPNGKETHIISLWENNKKFNSVKFHFDDNGNLDNKNELSTPFYTKDAPELKDNPFDKLYKNGFKQDSKPILEISAPKGVSELSLTNVRSENSLLANFVTDGILAGLKKHKPDTQVFGVLSATLRQGLPVGNKTTNIDLLNLLNGCIEDFSVVHTGKITGSELAEMITENVKDNIKDRNRNPIIQWSCIKVDEPELINTVNSGKIDPQTIQIKNEKGVYEPINMQQKYNVAVPKELFVVPNVKTAVRIQDKFTSTNLTMDSLLREYLKDNNYKVSTPDLNDVRIKT